VSGKDCGGESRGGGWVVVAGLDGGWVGWLCFRLGAQEKGAVWKKTGCCRLSYPETVCCGPAFRGLFVYYA
jgi:hypothetical protein